MNYLGAMTLSGTCFFLMIKLGRKISKNASLAKRYYSYLKVAIVFFLVPLFWLRSFYEEAYMKCRGRKTVSESGAYHGDNHNRCMGSCCHGSINLADQ